VSVCVLHLERAVEVGGFGVNYSFGMYTYPEKFSFELLVLCMNFTVNKQLYEVKLY
jgi:hypothetical protein